MRLVKRLDKYESLRLEWNRLADARDELERMGQRITARLCGLAWELGQLEKEFTAINGAVEVISEMEKETVK